jgi:chemotaxis protein methyltransferase CheR
MTQIHEDHLIGQEEEREKIEVEMLLEAVYRYYGFDFRNYAFPSIKRRLLHRIHAEGLKTITSLQEKVLHDPASMERLLADLSINVTAMFRDPNFFLSFRKNVIPILRTYPFIRIWHAGCSTGEEVYSMAILLHEEGLYERTRIYATDMNENVLQVAKGGIFQLDKMKDYTKNYLQAGGTKSFSEYYTAIYNAAKFQPFLKKNIIFAQHNLVTDQSFNEFNVILCRNVMIYFDRKLQEHVHDLFYESLSMFGVLGLGNKESMRFMKHSVNYEEIDAQEKIYRKIH